MAENTETNPPRDHQPTSSARDGMAAASHPTSAASNNNTGALFRAFDSYPWQKDQVFTAQLLEALHNFAPDGPSLSEIALLARARRFEEQTKIHVDAGSYKQWLTQAGAQPPRIISEQTVVQEAMAVPDPDERRLARMLVDLGDELGTLSLQYKHGQPVDGGGGGGGGDVPVPSWQAAAPKADLYIQKNKNASSSPADPDKEPYPKKFEEIIEFLKTGKEIPGIRKIPDTVVEDPTITTEGRLKAPPKPWEVGRTAGT